MSTAIAKLAGTTGVSSDEITEVVRNMIVSSKAQHNAVATNAEMTVVAGICAKYDLNPMMREVHAFVSGGKLQVMIGLDGWFSIMNRNKDFDGFEQFDNLNDKGELISVTTKIYVKGRKYPTPHTEYMDEAYQPKSDAWRKYKKRMLANKSLGQTIRVAFGISEIIDNDEADRIKSNSPKDITPKIEVDFDAIEAVFAECGDDETLRQAASNCRAELEVGGAWNSAKAQVAAMRLKHKDRIEAMLDDNEVIEQEAEVEDQQDINVEFEEVVTG